MERLQVYLDANIIYGFFLAKIRIFKKQASRFVEPKLIEFLRLNTERLDLFVSCVTKAEIIRRMRTEFDLKEKDVEAVWQEFLDWVEVKEMEKVVVTSTVVEIVKKEKFKKRITNIIHLAVSKNENMYFLSGDKEITAKGKKFYDKVLS